MWNQILTETKDFSFKSNGERINFYALEMTSKKCCSNNNTEYKFSEGKFTFCGKSCERNKQVKSLIAKLYNDDNLTEINCNDLITEINSILPPGRVTDITFEMIQNKRVDRYSAIETKIDLPLQYCLEDKTNHEVIVAVDINDYEKYFDKTQEYSIPEILSLKRLLVIYNSSFNRLFEFINVHQKFKEKLTEISGIQSQDFGEIMFNILYPQKVPDKCKYNNTILFDTFHKGYRKFCGMDCKCLNELKEENAINNVKFSYKYGMLSYKEQTGFDYPFLNPEVKEKIKQTNLERYGNEYSIISAKVQNKIKQTNQGKYGVDYPFQSEEIRNLSHETNRNNNGDCFAVARKTYSETIGIESVFQSPEWQQQIRQERYELYGSSSPVKIPGVLEQMKQKEFEANGCEHSTQRNWTDETKEIILNDNIVWEDYVKQNGGIDATANKLGVSWRVVNRKLIEQNPDYKGSKSSIEDAIEYFLQENGIAYEKNNRKILNDRRELDFYLPDNNVAIEYHSLKYHTIDNSHIKDIYYHKNKFEECKKKGIHLLSIFQDNYFTNLQNIKKYILTLCGKNISNEINVYEEMKNINEINEISYHNISDNYNRCFVSKDNYGNINGIIALNETNFEAIITNFFYIGINGSKFLEIVLNKLQSNKISFESNNDYFDFVILEENCFKKIIDLPPKSRFVKRNYIVDFQTEDTKEIYDCGGMLYLLEKVVEK